MLSYTHFTCTVVRPWKRRCDQRETGRGNVWEAGQCLCQFNKLCKIFRRLAGWLAGNTFFRTPAATAAALAFPHLPLRSWLLLAAQAETRCTSTPPGCRHRGTACQRRQAAPPRCRPARSPSLPRLQATRARRRRCPAGGCRTPRARDARQTGQAGRVRGAAGRRVARAAPPEGPAACTGAAGTARTSCSASLRRAQDQAHERSTPLTSTLSLTSPASPLVYIAFPPPWLHTPPHPPAALPPGTPPPTGASPPSSRAPAPAGIARCRGGERTDSASGRCD